MNELTENELIETLKDPKQARQMGWLRKYRPEEFEILTNAGHENRLALTGSGHWRADIGRALNGDCLILKPDYQPEPEYEDIEIKARSDSHWLEVELSPGQHAPISQLCNMATFVKFYSDICKRVSFTDVPDSYRTAQSRGSKVYARLLKVTQ